MDVDSGLRANREIDAGGVGGAGDQLELRIDGDEAIGMSPEEQRELQALKQSVQAEEQRVRSGYIYIAELP